MTTTSSASSVLFTLSASASNDSSLSTSTPPLPASMSLFFSASSLPPSSTSSVISSNQTECLFDDAAIRLPLTVCYLLFFLFGLVGNLFALWVFLCLHSSHNSVRVFLINCAVADLVLLTCLPFRVFYHANGNKWVLGPMACKLVGNLFYMNMYISIALLGFISLDRYLRLKGRGRARRGMALTLCGRRWPWSWLACGALWGVSLMGALPLVITGDNKVSADNKVTSDNQCFHYRKLQGAKWKAYFNGALVALFWLVFVMLVVSYAKIAAELMRVSRDKPDLPNAHKYQRTAKKSFFVLFLFTVCFGPYHAFRPVYILSQVSDTASCSYLKLVDHTNEVMLLLSALNSCMDPVMYFLLSGSVRKTALRALGQRFGHRLPFLHEATSNSSTTELRRLSLPNTPRNSVFNINSTLFRPGQTTLPPTGQQ
ncbi:probable G-protein coupled receptor 34 [Solea solea]|uniref:probable G-protein coupled receptor 34 n=1 Tax=Solea solea TaxID=90069 RepID=UPI00272C516E|nr:probable G-protein coupled receptor 34 [Solea solea]